MIAHVVYDKEYLALYIQQEFFQEVDEGLRVHCFLVDHPAELPAHADRRYHADRLPFSGEFHDGGLADGRPGGYGVVIVAAPGFICEEDARPFLISARLDGGEGLVHPFLAALLGPRHVTVDRALRRKAEHLQDSPDILLGVVDAEFPPDQFPDSPPGPQAEVELELPRIQAKQARQP